MGPEETMVLTCAVVYAAILAISYWRPNVGRLVCGFFFIAMGLGVNTTLAIVAPDSFPALGTGSVLPIYRWFFGTIVAAHPLFWVLPVGVAWEVTAGVLMLTRGRYVKAGLIMALLFLIGITPFSAGTLANIVFALSFQYLLTKNYDRSLIDMVLKRNLHHSEGRQVA